MSLKPRFFDQWLVERGCVLISSTATDASAVEASRRLDEVAYVRDEELVCLADSWRTYRGREITPEHVRAWLNQFDNNIERRLMYVLLENVRFYDELAVREKIRIIHNSVVSQITRERRGTERSSRDLLVSSIGTRAKSGSTYQRMYYQENQVLSENSVELGKIGAAIADNERIKAVVLVDDIVGTGTTYVEGVKTLNEACGKLLADKDIELVVTAICGTALGTKTVENYLNRCDFRHRVVVPDTLGDEYRAFHPTSSIFENEDDRRAAERIAKRVGAKLDRRQPLGYEGDQLLVSFSDSCPNNSLPILWKAASGTTLWKPLFPRG